MGFVANKTSVETIKECAFRVTYFRDIYSRINGKLYRKSWNEFDELKNISVNKYGVKFGTSLRFWENKE